MRHRYCPRVHRQDVVLAEKHPPALLFYANDLFGWSQTYCASACSILGVLRNPRSVSHEGWSGPIRTIVISRGRGHPISAQVSPWNSLDWLAAMVSRLRLRMTHGLG